MNLAYQAWLAAQVSTVLQAALCLLLYGTSYSGMLFRGAFYSCLVAYCLSLWQAHGFPRLSKDWWGRVALSDNVPYIFYCLIFLSGPPTAPLVLLPPSTAAALYVSQAAREVLPRAAPSVHALVDPYLQAFVENREQALHFMATAEIFNVLALILSTFFYGMRQLLTLFMYYQFLSLRWRLSSHTQRVVASMTASVDRIVQHPSCPGAVGALWYKAKGAASAMMQPPAPAR